MRSIRSGLLAAIPAVVAMVGSALAADKVVVPPRPAAPVAPPAPVIKSYAGWYVGVVGGYGFGSSRVSNVSPATTGNFDVNGPMIGGTLGINFQAGTLVYGVEGDLSWTNIRGSGTLGGTLTQRALDVGTIRGRIGTVRSQALLYFTGGWATARFDYYGPFTGRSASNGFTVGAGAEVFITPRITLKGEYLYVRLSQSNPVSPAPASATTTDYWRVNMLRAGLNLHF